MYIMGWKKIARFIIFVTFLVTSGVYIGLGSFSYFIYFALFCLAGILISAFYLTFSHIDKYKIFKHFYLLMFCVGSLLICVATYQIKNYCNLKRGELLVDAIEEYKFKNNSYPSTLTDLVPEYQKSLPKYIFKLNQHSYNYLVSPRKDFFFLEYNIDNYTYRSYKSQFGIWYIED